MLTSVRDRCRAIATFRHVSVRLMEIVASWTPTAPEMEVKVMFGKHIWRFAQMADLLGKRTFELRKPMHHSLPPVGAYEALLDDVAARRSSGERIAALYDGLLPGLIDRYRRYVADTDPVLDEPSVDIVGRIVGMLEQQRADAAELLSTVEIDMGSRDRGVGARDTAIASIVAA